MADAPPTFAVPPGFMGLGRRDGARVAVAGIPLDIGTTNRAGARFGPAAIRSASRMLVDGVHPGSFADVGALAEDLGDLPIRLGDLAGSLAAVEAAAAGVPHLLALGGEHTVTLPLLRALARRRGGPVGLIHFDAHVDTWPDNFGTSLGHGSVFYHALREGLVDPRRMIQVGIRSPVAREVRDWTTGQGVTIVPAMAVHEAGIAATLARIRAVVAGAPAYLSFDIDALDPAFAPGTGTPEIGGLASWQAQALMRGLGGLDLVGMDVVEVAPPYDVAEITALAAASIAFEYLALVAQRPA